MIFHATLFVFCERFPDVYSQLLQTAKRHTKQKTNDVTNIRITTGLHRNLKRLPSGRKEIIQTSLAATMVRWCEGG
jgi:hypothetical protein